MIYARRVSRLVSRLCSAIDASRGAIVGAVVLCGMQCMALAQEDAPLRPPKVTDPPVAPKIIVYLVLALLVGGVIFAATLKSKRSHQD